MPLKIKDIATLKQDFNNLLIQLLANEKIKIAADEKITAEHIKSLKADRVPLLQFLHDTLTYLDTSKEKLIPEAFRPQVFYGAAYLAIAKIGDTRWGQNTPAKKAILGLLGESEQDQPTNEQLVQFYKSCNVYLTTIFTKYDSRQGIKETHALSELNTKDILAFLHTGYLQEQRSQNALITSIAARPNTTNKNELSGFTFRQQLPKTPSWQDLTEGLNLIVQTQIGDKNCGSFKELAGITKYRWRTFQLGILQDVEKCLAGKPKTKDTEAVPPLFTPEQRAAILMGTMLLIYRQIKSEISTKSFVYDKLIHLINPEAINSQDTEALIGVASQFLRFSTIATDEKQEKAFCEQHLFTDTLKLVKYDQSYLRDLLISFTDNIYVQREGALEELKKLELASEKSSAESAEKPKAEKTGGVLSTLTFGFLGSKSKPVVEEDKPEHTADAGTSSAPSMSGV